MRCFTVLLLLCGLAAPSGAESPSEWSARHAHEMRALSVLVQKVDKRLAAVRNQPVHAEEALYLIERKNQLVLERELKAMLCERDRRTLVALIGLQGALDGKDITKAVSVRDAGLQMLDCSGTGLVRPGIQVLPE